MIEGKSFDVLVTDSELKHGLAVIRCLGRKKVKVLCSSSKRINPSVFSRYSSSNILYSRKYFIKDIINVIKKNKIDVVMPVGYHSNIECSKHKKEILRYSKMVISDYPSVELASDKWKTTVLADKLGIPHPKSWLVKNMADVDKINFEGKLIIKSLEEMKGKKIDYIDNLEELREVVKKRLVNGPQIVQERIEGFGCGFFCLFKDGKNLASFQHKRIREFPASGGTSSAAESYFNPLLEKYGTKILKELKWNGIAMVEFIYDKKDKKYKLLEINPKFWGSLDLSIESGVGFPYLLYLSAMGKKFQKPSYKRGIRFQWILPEDVLHVKTSENKWQSFKIFIRDVCSKNTKKDTQYLLKDPLPTMIRGLATIYKLIK